MSGIATTDEISPATRVGLHSGPAARCGLLCLVLPDSGSPRTFVLESFRKRMTKPGAATAHGEYSTRPRMWGGFGKSPMSTSISVRLSVQFYENTTTTA